MTEPSSEQMVRAWRALAASHAAVCSALERELGERHGLGVSDFEVLERLAESEGHQFRAQELADAVHLSQSALSRLISRLEKTGLVERNVLALLDEEGEDLAVLAIEDERRLRVRADLGQRRRAIERGNCAPRRPDHRERSGPDEHRSQQDGRNEQSTSHVFQPPSG